MTRNPAPGSTPDLATPRAEVCGATSEDWPGLTCQLMAGHDGFHKADIGTVTVEVPAALDPTPSEGASE